MEAKDYLTLSVAAISCALSIVTFARTLRKDQRSFIECYARDRWERTRAALETHLSAVDSWLYQIEKRERDCGYIRHLKNEGNIKFDHVLRKYAKDLARTLDHYLAVVDDLTREVNSYNNL